jgi:TrmH family RNA methyltransferase
VDAAREAGLAPVELLVAGETVAPELLAEVSTLGHPARVIGVYRRDDLPHGTRDAMLALWHVADPGNVGTLLRSADAFGAGVALSAGCADPTGPKALRASAGALFRVPVCGFEEAPGRRVALVAHGGTPLADVDLARPVVLVLGAEREGLPEDVLARCDVRASIPQTGGVESLNVAMAGTIALYELAQRSS